MRDPNTMIEEDIPSRRRDVIAALRRDAIVRLTRYSWSPAETVAREDQLRPELVFSRTAGPLLITLDSGLVIGAGSQPSLISVTLWFERTPRTSCDPELHAIEADDPQYSEPGFAQMLGKHAVAAALLIREPEGASWESRPREAGLAVSFRGAPDLILSHGLHDDSDDFSVVTREGVLASLWPRLRELRID